jgi:hypothetical protein
MLWLRNSEIFILQIFNPKGKNISLEWKPNWDKAVFTFPNFMMSTIVLIN